jgi:hypothetical protein
MGCRFLALSDADKGHAEARAAHKPGCKKRERQGAEHTVKDGERVKRDDRAAAKVREFGFIPQIRFCRRRTRPKVKIVK